MVKGLCEVLYGLRLRTVETPGTSYLITTKAKSVTSSVLIRSECSCVGRDPLFALKYTLHQIAKVQEETLG
jgi:hypothetical protein